MLADVSGGTFTLSWNNGSSTSTTDPIDWTANAGDIRGKLEAITGAGNVVVTGGPLPTGTITVTFVNTYALTNVAQMSANAVGLTGDGARSFVKSVQASSIRDTYEWTGTTDTTVTAPVSLNANTIMVKIGIEFTNPTPQSGAALLLEQASAADWSLTLANTPTVTKTATDTLDLYSGVITIGSRTLTFSKLAVDSGTLTIAEGDDGWSIVSSASGYRFYGPESRIVWSDPDQWLTVQPGANAVSHTITGAGLIVSFHGGFQ